MRTSKRDGARYANYQSVGDGYGVELPAIVGVDKPTWLRAGQPRKFPKCRQLRSLVCRAASCGAPRHENTKAEAMGRARGSAIVQVGAGRSRRIEDSSRAGPSRRISEANGKSDGDTVEEVAVEGPRMHRPDERSAADLQPKTAANLPHKPERSVSISAVEERLIELRKNGQPK